MAGYEVAFASGMAEIDREEWDALASPNGSPLLSWGFLALLEASGSIAPATGWTPAHELIRLDGRLVAAAPFYVKAHSWGEFVFDFGFAEAAEAAGLAWYPKLVGTVPATPAPAWRVLVGKGEDERALAELAVAAAEDAARSAGLAGMHALWPEPRTADLLRDLRWPEWSHQAFLWTDAGYGDFPGYLDSFSKNMRRNVRRERAAVAAAGVETRMIGPEEARSRPGLLESMAKLYDSHNAKFGPWAARFLERDFFLRLPEYMETGWAIAAAFEKGGGAAFDSTSSRAAARGSQPDPIALAFFLEGGDRLYGRFWGARRELPGLHFELCYYLPIEYALSRGISSFDPGMGSPHKARRGFRSIDAPSFHRPFEPRLSALMDRVLPEANAAEAARIEALNEELPFKSRRG